MRKSQPLVLCAIQCCDPVMTQSHQFPWAISYRCACRSETRIRITSPTIVERTFPAQINPYILDRPMPNVAAASDTLRAKRGTLSRNPPAPHATSAESGRASIRRRRTCLHRQLRRVQGRSTMLRKGAIKRDITSTRCLIQRGMMAKKRKVPSAQFKAKVAGSAA